MGNKFKKNREKMYFFQAYLFVALIVNLLFTTSVFASSIEKALSKADEMCSVTWTPTVSFPTWQSSKGINNTVKDINGTSTGTKFLTGHTYQGIPYTMYTGSWNGINRNRLDEDEWMTFLKSHSSVSDYSGYVDSVRTNSCKIGVDCSGLVQRALQAAGCTGVSGLNTTDLANGKFNNVFTKLGSFNELQPGDILNKGGSHMVLVKSVSGNNLVVYESNASYSKCVIMDRTKAYYNSYTAYRYKNWESSHNVDPASHNPVMNVDLCVGGTEEIWVTGWAYDPDNTNAQLNIHVYVGGSTGSGAPYYSENYANKENTSVDEIYHVGAYHGFSMLIPVDKRGDLPVYVYAINVGEGVYTEMGPYNVNVKDAVDAFQYEAHVADKGWLGKVNNGQTAGTTGETRKLEAISLRLNKDGQSKIAYTVHMSDKGWMPVETHDGQTAGTIGEGRSIEAIGIMLENGFESLYDIYYRVHIQNIGWTGWACNGDYAGSEGRSWPLEAYEVKMVPKGTAFDKGGTAFYPPDTEAPKITGEKACCDTAGYRIECEIADNEGVSKVEMYHWTASEGAEQAIKAPMVFQDGKYRLYVSYSDHKNAEDYYYNDIYAYDARGNESRCRIIFEHLRPKLSDIIVIPDETGYTVSCKVTDDESGVNRVQFPSWTSENGQDDIISDWLSNPKASGKVGDDGTYTYHVNISDHNFELGTYNTHIYAYDNSGNQRVRGIESITLLKLKYDGNGGNCQKENKVVAKNYAIGTLEEPSRDHYSFQGWYSEKTGGNQITEDTICEWSENTTIYAHWESPFPDMFMPEALSVIEEEAFAECTFTYAALSDNTEAIKKGAFKNCKNLKFIYIPEKTVSIANDAFEGVQDLTVFGTEGSYAEYYAGKHGFQFVAE